MQHLMRLNAEPFERMESGEKTIELRLHDEKRRKIKMGDIIRFQHKENEARVLTARVIALHVFSSFTELYQNLPLLRLGYTEQNVQNAAPEDMDEYYSKTEQKKYGVVGIEFKLL